MVFIGWVLPLHGDTAAPPDDADPDRPPTLTLIEEVDAIHDEWLEDAKKNPDIRVWRGLRADRAQQSVQIIAEATGLATDHPAEFLLISTRSGHDYEALAISYARPSELHEALEFIGIPAGAPFNPRDLRFFPKGERVLVTVRWTDREENSHAWPAEALVRDSRTNASIPEDGFVFVGSHWLEEDGERRYAADTYDPHSLISLYNEPTTVLDVPRPVSQGDVYGFLRPYPGRQPEQGQRLEILFEPEFKDGRSRIADITLDIRAGAEDAPIHLTLYDDDGEALHDGVALRNVFGALNRLIRAERTPFLHLRIGDEVPLKEIRDLVRLLVAFEEEEDLHFEPPAPGDLFYRAFIPAEAHRDPANRPSQALELRLERDGPDLAGRVVNIRDIRARREDEFEAEVTEYDVSTPAQLPSMLAEIQHHLPVLLVFAPADLTYGTLMEWLRPVRDTHPTVHIFQNTVEKKSNSSFVSLNR